MSLAKIYVACFGMGQGEADRLARLVRAMQEYCECLHVDSRVMFPTVHDHHSPRPDFIICDDFQRPDPTEAIEYFATITMMPTPVCDEPILVKEVRHEVATAESKQETVIPTRCRYVGAWDCRWG